MIDLEELEKMVDQALAKESWEELLNEENKMKDQVLSIQRMQHLKELGVDTSKASMCWMKYRSENASWILSLMRDIVPLDYDTHEIVPAYTLQDLLEMMPCKLYCDETGYTIRLKPTLLYLPCYLTLVKCQDSEYEIAYTNRIQKYLQFASGKTILDAVYSMLCWLAENKLLGKEKKK